MFNIISSFKDFNVIIVKSLNKYAVVYYENGIKNDGLLVGNNLSLKSALELRANKISELKQEFDTYDIVVSLDNKEDVADAISLIVVNKISEEAKEVGYGIIRFNLKGQSEDSLYTMIKELFHSSYIPVRSIAVNKE